MKEICTIYFDGADLIEHIYDKRDNLWNEISNEERLNDPDYHIYLGIQNGILKASKIRNMTHYEVPRLRQLISLTIKNAA